MTVRLPTNAAARKRMPIARGVLDYFPAALAAVAEVSLIGGEQHHPGAPLHWERGKSEDHADCLLRHMIERGTVDSDGSRHSAKLAWRALALLQTEIEGEQDAVDPVPTGVACGPRVYVAGRFQSYEKVRGMIDALRSRGFIVTYDWTRTGEFDAEGHPFPADKDRDQGVLRTYAENDLRGVKEADFLVLMADDSLAGAWVEMGAALAQGKEVHVIAPERWTIFLECDQVHKHESAAAFLSWLDFAD